VVEWLVANLEEFTYFGIALCLFVAGLGVPIPEDIPLIFGGVMAGAGKIDVWWHFGISMAFILIGDSCLFFIGRRLSRNADASKGWFGRLLSPGRRHKATAYFNRWGAWTVFFGRFVAGIRGAVFLTAGAAGYSYPRFVLMDGLAALVSVPVWIWLGYTFGENWEEIMEQAKTTQGWVLGGLAILVILGLVGWKLYKKRQKAEA
jgi:membrane protein DedA with SNARE-associated domain